MLKKLGLAVSVFAFVAGTSSIASAGDPLKPCAACHFLDKGASEKKSNLGPGLKGVFNRPVSIEGTPFTTWDEASLNTWLSDPGAVKKGTKMSFKQKNDDKRAAIIEALKNN